MSDPHEPLRPNEFCAQCGFDSDLYDRADTISSQSVIAPVLAAAVEGLEPTALRIRPDETTWSIAEYLDHVREVAFGNRFAIDVALSTPGTDLGDPPSRDVASTRRSIDVDAALDAIATEFVALGELIDGLTDEQWSQTVLLGGEELPVGWFARHVLHDALHHLGDIGRIRHGLGLGARTEVGTVGHLSVSSGGVPKHLVDVVDVTPSGVVGDAQSDRRHHGRPLQAICLWSVEVIGSLQQEGHPIGPGNAGENITISGVDWTALRPGSRLDVGPVALLVSAHAIPCSKNAQWFSDRKFDRIRHEQYPGASRLYAIPLNAGRVSVGDEVVIEPAGQGAA